MFSRQGKTNTFLNLIIKCSAISFLFLISILIVACSANGSSQVDPGTPIATVTIKLGQDIGSPTPKQLPYYCGGWATDTSPPFSSTSTVSVYGKFTQIVDGNPVGVGGASAIATVTWPDINILFTSTQNVQCTIPSAAYFTAILVSPTPTNTAVPSPTPSGSSTPGGTVTPTGSPPPTATQKPGH